MSMPAPRQWDLVGVCRPSLCPEGHLTKRGRISPIPTMANALTLGTSLRPVISDQCAPLHVAEQADTYFWALILAGLLAMRGLQYEMGFRRVF